MTDMVHSPASQLEAQITVAKALAASDLLPVAFRGKAPNVLVVLALGEALGIAPTTALYGINVINGKPTLSAELMRAIVLAHGHRFDVEEFTEVEARVACARAERPNDVSRFAFTIEDAKRAGLIGGNYDKYPKAMLLARVTSQACRAVFPDVLAGVSYTPDELMDVPQLVETHRPRAWSGEPVPGRDYTPEGAIDGTVRLLPEVEELVEAELILDDAIELVEELAKDRTPQEVDAVLATLEEAGVITIEPHLVEPDPLPRLTGPAARSRSHTLAGPATSAQLGKLRAVMREQKVTPAILGAFARERLGFELPDDLEQLTRGQASQLIDSMVGGA